MPEPAIGPPFISPSDQPLFICHRCHQPVYAGTQGCPALEPPTDSVRLVHGAAVHCVQNYRRWAHPEELSNINHDLRMQSARAR